MRANPTGYVGAWHGSPEDWYDHAEEPFAAGPNSHLHYAGTEPIGGVALHLDLGVAPTDPANESEFGDWSTGSSRALVPDFIVNVVDAIDGDVTVTINGVGLSFDATGLTPAEIAMLVGFAVVGTGEPVDIKSYTDNGDGTATVVFEAQEHSVHFTRGISVPLGYEDSIEMPREDDESLRSHYESDTAQVDAVRVGRLRYGVAVGLDGGGQAYGARFVSGLAHGALIHELGHTLGLQHWGNDAWGTNSAGCLPHYQSMMRYGKPPYRFSDTDGVDSLNPGAVQETETFGATYDHLIYGLAPYYYAATSSTVDWNWDGTPSPIGTSWRAPAMSIYDDGYSYCGAFVLGRDRIVPNEDVVGAVDLTRAGTRLYAFWATGSALKYKYTTLGSIGDESCTGTADPASGACLTWSSTYYGARAG